jgi:hypothetical protein
MFRVCYLQVEAFQVGPRLAPPHWQGKGTEEKNIETRLKLLLRTTADRKRIASFPMSCKLMLTYRIDNPAF